MPTLQKIIKRHLGTCNGGLCNNRICGSNKLNKRMNATPFIAANVVLVGTMTYVVGFQGYIS